MLSRSAAHLKVVNTEQYRMHFPSKSEHCANSSRDFDQAVLHSTFNNGYTNPDVYRVLLMSPSLPDRFLISCTEKRAMVAAQCFGNLKGASEDSRSSYNYPRTHNWIDMCAPTTDGRFTLESLRPFSIEIETSGIYQGGSDASRLINRRP